MTDCESRGMITVRRKDGKVHCRSRPKAKKVSGDISNRDFLLGQSVTGLKSYIISRDVNKILSGWNRLKKEELVDFILDNIDVETGEVKKKLSKLIIPKRDQNRMLDDKTFKFSDEGVIYTDIYQDLEKNILFVLMKFSRYVVSKGYKIPGYYKMKKADLVKALNKIVIFE